MLPSTAKIVRARFPRREALDTQLAIQTIWAALPAEALESLAQVFDLEYGIPLGFFRPEDQLAWLADPLPLTRWWRWPWDEFGVEDAWSELSSELAKRAGRNALQDYRKATFGELAAAWCSRLTSA